uniref:Carboxy-lyase n=1 Tax=Rhizophora mucronata TaxID=61149 RepID=A0A2P2JLS6_RHIMU
MGFSMTGSFKSHCLVKNFRENSLTIQSFKERRAFSIDIKRPKLRLFSRSFLLCRNESFDFEERTSPGEIREEIQRCYELIHRLGRGVTYLGSSRMGPNHPHYLQSLELGKEIAKLLDCTSWTGAGSGLMDAVTKGALEAGKVVGGFKIAKEAGQWTASNFHAYLPSDTYVTCRYKHILWMPSCLCI